MSTPFRLCLRRRMFLNNSFEQLKQFPYQLRPTKKTSQSDRTHIEFALHTFFLLEHLNFSSGWMCLFFQPFSASNVLIDVLNRNSNEKSKQHHYTSKIESIDLFTKLKTIFSFLRNSSLFCFITELVNINFLFSLFLISAWTCS